MITIFTFFLSILRACVCCPRLLQAEGSDHSYWRYVLLLLRGPSFSTRKKAARVVKLWNPLGLEVQSVEATLNFIFVGEVWGPPSVWANFLWYSFVLYAVIWTIIWVQLSERVSHWSHLHTHGGGDSYCMPDILETKERLGGYEGWKYYLDLSYI